MDDLYKKLLELYMICFPEDSEAYARFFIDNKFDGTNCMTLFDGDKLINMLFLVKKQICVRGTVFDIPYMVAGGTHPDYRGRGIFTKVLLEAMQNFKSMGNRPLTGLMPSAHVFYLRQNYVTHSFVQYRQLSSEGGLPLKEMSFADIPAMQNVYDRFVNGKSGWFMRDQASFDLRLRELFLEGGKAYGMYEGNKLSGYALSFDGQSIDEYVAEDIQLIEHYDTPFEEYPVHTVSSGEEENMIRICDNVALLQSICYDTSLNTNVTIEVVDPFHTANSGKYKLSINGGKGTVMPTQTADFTLTIEDFTKLVMGCYAEGSFDQRLQSIFPAITNCPVEKF